jgi:prophage regulatory protein
MIKNNGPNESPMPPDGDDHASGGSPRKMLSEKQVLALFPIARSTLWRMERRGEFPKGTYVLANRKFWFEDEIAAFQIALEGQARGRRTRRKA